jgi:hypothetical protein
MRIRSIAEHAMIPDPADEMKNTRTTVARWWERLLIAPNCVNFHLEHHLLPTVPHYNLRRMHRMLRERGALADACVAGATRRAPPGGIEDLQVAGRRPEHTGERGGGSGGTTTTAARPRKRSKRRASPPGRSGSKASAKRPPSS